MVESAVKEPTPTLSIEQVSINDLAPDPANPRLTGQGQRCRQYPQPGPSDFGSKEAGNEANQVSI